MNTKNGVKILKEIQQMRVSITKNGDYYRLIAERTFPNVSGAEFANERLQNKGKILRLVPKPLLRIREPHIIDLLQTEIEGVPIYKRIFDPLQEDAISKYLLAVQQNTQKDRRNLKKESYSLYRLQREAEKQ